MYLICTPLRGGRDLLYTGFDFGSTSDLMDVYDECALKTGYLTGQSLLWVLSDNGEHNKLTIQQWALFWKELGKQSVVYGIHKYFF